jgi:hypothetical protein
VGLLLAIGFLEAVCGNQAAALAESGAEGRRLIAVDPREPALL